MCKEYNLMASLMFAQNRGNICRLKFSLSVTVGNSLTAPGTLGSYQTLEWTRLVHAGVNTAGRNHSYHLTHKIY